MTKELSEIVEPLLAEEPQTQRQQTSRGPSRRAHQHIVFMFEGDILREMLTKEMGCGSGPTCWRSCSRVRRWGLTITNLVAPCPVDKLYPAFRGKLTKPIACLRITTAPAA